VQTRPHGNFTPLHADGAATNAVKRSSRKYHCVKHEIVAGRTCLSRPAAVGVCRSYRQTAVMAHPSAWLPHALNVSGYWYEIVKLHRGRMNVPLLIRIEKGRFSDTFLEKFYKFPFTLTNKDTRQV